MHIRISGQVLLEPMLDFPFSEFELDEAGTKLLAHVVALSKIHRAGVAGLALHGSLGESPARLRVLGPGGKPPEGDDDVAGYAVTMINTSYVQMLVVGHLVDGALMAYADGRQCVLMRQNHWIKAYAIGRDHRDGTVLLTPNDAVLPALMMEGPAAESTQSVVH
jgi:hypothetical protein